MKNLLDILELLNHILRCLCDSRCSGRNIVIWCKMAETVYLSVTKYDLSDEDVRRTYVIKIN